MNRVSRVESSGLGRAVREIGDGWSLLIVWEALNGTTRFENFQIALGIARSSLSNRLAKLVEVGVLAKRPAHPGTRRSHIASPHAEKRSGQL